MEPSEIDFSLVKEIYQKISSDDFPIHSFDQLPAPERDVANLAVIEQQLLVIALHVKLEFSLKVKKDALAGVLIHIKNAYTELEEDNKHMLLPIFFTGDMLEENTHYIKDETERKAALAAYIALIKGDDLKLQALKREFIKQFPLGYLLPLYPHLDGVEAKEEVEGNFETLNSSVAHSKTHVSTQDKEQLNDVVKEGINKEEKGKTQKRYTLLFLGFGFILLKLSLISFVWAAIFIVMPERAKIEAPLIVQLILGCGATIWIWYGLRQWWKKED